jgi:hypothetical protein
VVIAMHDRRYIIKVHVGSEQLGTAITVRRYGPQQAADHFAQKMAGREEEAWASRVTGDEHEGGWFQAFRPSLNGPKKFGPHFLVEEY